MTNQPENLPKPRSASSGHWELAEPGEERVALCGKGTHIVVYDNGTVSIARFFCNRWDCPRCGPNRANRIKEKVLAKCSDWYVTIPNEKNNYGAIKKRSQRADAKYCALGGPELRVILTNKPISNPPWVWPKDLLGKLIDLVLLYPSPYEYRKRRFNHSVHLFDPSDDEDPRKHIVGILVVRESRRQVEGSLEKRGYVVRSSHGGMDYLRGKLDNPEKIVDDLVENGHFHIIGKHRKNCPS